MIRGGFGLFYDAFPDGVVDNFAQNPPLYNTFTVGTPANPGQITPGTRRQSIYRGGKLQRGLHGRIRNRGDPGRPSDRSARICAAFALLGLRPHQNGAGAEMELGESSTPLAPTCRSRSGM